MWTGVLPGEVVRLERFALVGRRNGDDIRARIAGDADLVARQRRQMLQQAAEAPYGRMSGSSWNFVGDPRWVDGQTVVDHASERTRNETIIPALGPSS
jgi:hypothetical protein